MHETGSQTFISRRVEATVYVELRSMSSLDVTRRIVSDDSKILDINSGALASADRAFPKVLN